MSKPLNDAREFAASVLYAPPAHLDALTLACAVTHVTDAFDTVPRVLFTSANPQSGKSTALDVFAMLSHNSWRATGATSFALRAKFNASERPTLLLDEISKVFGASGRNGNGSEIARIACDGYRRTATLPMSNGRMSEDVSAFCVMALAGLGNAAPEDVRQRSVVFPMQSKPAGITLRSSVGRDVEIVGKYIATDLRAWTRANVDAIARTYVNLPRTHVKLTDRRRQVWGSLFAIAEIAGDDWPARCLAAFKELALDAPGRPTDRRALILTDACSLIEAEKLTFLSARALLAHVAGLSDEIYRLSDVALFREFTAALGETSVTKVDGQPTRGWVAADVTLALKALQAAASLVEESAVSDVDPYAP